MTSAVLFKVFGLYLIVLVISVIGYFFGLSAVTSMCVGFIAAFALNLALTILDLWSEYRNG